MNETLGIRLNVAVELLIDGWKSWKYERSPGEWVLIDELRKKQ